MNQQELEAKVKEVFSDKAYVEELFKLETPEAVQASLKEKELELSIDDIVKLKHMLEMGQDGELDDEALESVSGGCIGIILGIAGACMAVAVGGLTAAAATWDRCRW